MKLENIEKYNSLQKENDDLMSFSQSDNITDIELDKTIERLSEINYELSLLD